MKRNLAVAALLAALTGCASLSPRFGQEVANAFAHDEMRKLETRSVELYYPAKDREAALRALTRLESCLEQLRKLPLSRTPRRKVLAYLTSAQFNNAYVFPQIIGFEQHMLLPNNFSLDLFNWFELGLTGVGDVSCHEAVHYVQLQQTEGVYELFNQLGGNVFAPNTVMETWFLEGLATYYEGRLGGDVGRSRNPMWRGMFLAGVAARNGELHPGDLNPGNRDLLPFGGNYLTGMHFVEYLARKYGEKRLWQLVHEQANSIFSPVLLSFRFNWVYGKHLGTLFDEFVEATRAELKGRVRPSGQRILNPDVGFIARIAGSRSDGAVASLSAGREQLVTLQVHEANGQVRFSRAMTPLLMPRPFITVHPVQVSGLSFSADGKRLYLVTADVAHDGAETSRLLELDAANGELQRKWDLGSALGGAVTPDGKGYVFVAMVGHDTNLARLDLDTGHREPLTRLTATSLGALGVSPDGTRIAFSRRVEDGFDLWLREADGTLVPLTHDVAFDYFPSWLDDQRILFLREVDGRLQAHVMDFNDRSLKPVTEAPFVAFDPVALGPDRVAFLNREAWGWTLDTMALPPPAPAPSPARLEEPSTPDAATAPEAVASAEAPGTPSDTAPATPAAPEAATSPAAARDAQPTTAQLPEGAVDRPYSPTDHLFWPTLHVPWLLPSLQTRDDVVRVGVSVGVSLQGTDRLGLHTWSLNASYDTLDQAPSVSAGYGNYQLAPWYFQATAARQVFRNVTEISGTLSASRSFWTTPVLIGLEARNRQERQADGTVSTVRLVGPTVGFSYFAGESTPYAGLRRGIGVALGATAYPRWLGSDQHMADLSGSLEGFVPLPGLARQSLALELRGRWLPGAPERLLQVGGTGRNSLTATLNGQPGEAAPDVTLPGGVSFVEPLRGYEDHALRATAAAIGGARYRYPFIIDRGFASLLYVFPSLFFRQVEAEAFVTAAYLNTENPWHRVAGGAVRLRMTLGSVLPTTIFYQYAQRFDDDLGGLHFFGLVFQ
ncbi:MAG TPA: hypothetical protein VK447_07675 [Myxococcaceae bacterium]|nr:hypothetical protein [Myxococcaceae bacterium]